MADFAKVSGDFAFQLFNQVSTCGQNSVLSPASITMALGMTYAGSDGNTKIQMNKVMYGGLKEEINENMQVIVNVINSPVEEYVLKTANRVYVAKSYQLLQTYLDTLRKYYQSDCIPADFAGNSGKICSEMNQWVEQITHNKIKNLVPPDAVTPDTRLILINAIYFKGNWTHPFNEKDTIKKPFHASSSKTIEVDMMRAKHKHFKFAANEKCQMLGIPYHSSAGNLAMFFVLPTERFGLNALEKNMTGADFVALLESSFSPEVEVELPKFKLEQSFRLTKPLTQLGITDAFTGDANFSKISGVRDLYISDVIHKAFVEVNEKGAEAAAATAVIMKRCLCMEFPSESRKFIADQPFLFAIVERLTNSILFLGHYYG